MFTCAGGCACARLGERAGGPTGAVAASVGRRGKRRGMRSSGGDSMVLTDVGTRRSPKKAWNGRTGMYRCAVGRYGRMARREVCGERGSNGNEVTVGADGAHCRRGFKRRSFSFRGGSFFAGTHSTSACATTGRVGMALMEAVCGEWVNVRGPWRVYYVQFHSDAIIDVVIHL